MEQPTTPSGYGIGAVTRLTGLPAHTLRIWERRYGAVNAQRSEAGRRLYSDADVARLLLLKQLSDRGDRIGRIANLSDESLRDRLKQHAEHRAHRDQAIATPRVAVFGELLAAKLNAGLPGCEVVTAAHDLALFTADVLKLRPDVLIVELTALDPDTDELLANLRAASGAGRVIVVFGFARRQDVARLSDDATLLVRAPAEAAELAVLVHSSHQPQISATPEPGDGEEDLSAAQIPPRRYTAAELARLRAVNGTVQCECPAQLVELVSSLSAFEAYSAQCESRNPADAALHAWLHRTTAAARARMEDALTRVAKAEGLL